MKRKFILLFILTILSSCIDRGYWMGYPLVTWNVSFEFKGVDAERVNLYMVSGYFASDKLFIFEIPLEELSYSTTIEVLSNSDSCFETFYFTIEDSNGDIAYFSGWEEGFKHQPDNLSGISFEHQNLGILTYFTNGDISPTNEVYNIYYTSKLLETGWNEGSNQPDYFYTITVNESQVEINLETKI